MENSELYHHGVKGMHWGVRRYQNADGTRTDAGKRRDAKKSALNASKNRSIMSDKDLDARIERLQKEKRLKQLTDEQYRSGRTTAKRLLGGAAGKVAAAALAGGMAYAGGAILNNYHDGKKFTNVIKDAVASINYSELARYAFPNPNKKK